MERIDWQARAIQAERERDELAAALEELLQAFSLETAVGVDASIKRTEAKKKARAALAKVQS